MFWLEFSTIIDDYLLARKIALGMGMSWPNWIVKEKLIFQAGDLLANYPGRVNDPIELHTARTTDAQWSLFSSKFQFFGLGQTILADKFLAIWGIFGRFISTHFGTVSPLFMFSINQPLFLQKLSLYIQIVIWDLNFSRKELGI